MVTGMVLYRPPPEDGVTVAEGQLKMMVNLLGEIPKEMINESKWASQYFDHRGSVLQNVALTR